MLLLGRRALRSLMVMPRRIQDDPCTMHRSNAMRGAIHIARSPRSSYSHRRVVIGIGIYSTVRALPQNLWSRSGREALIFLVHRTHIVVAVLITTSRYFLMAAPWSTK
jgi:hypothetical protein